MHITNKNQTKYCNAENYYEFMWHEMCIFHCISRIQLPMHECFGVWDGIYIIHLWECKW